MIGWAAALVFGASGTLPESWNCRNQIEVWCAADGCRVTPADAFTPLDIWASEDGDLSVCAYSGCWSGRASPSRRAGRLTWSSDELPHSSTDGAAEEVTLLILAKDGVGFVRARGLATPVLCARVKKLGD